MMSGMDFYKEPVFLSPEHAAQAERFQGYPYDPVGDAKCSAYAAFKKWHHDLMVARDALKVTDSRRLADERRCKAKLRLVPR